MRNKFMMIKWIISWNSSTQNMLMIFWMLTFRCFRIYWWSPLLKIFMQSLLCCFINMEERMFQSQISCHTFLCLYQPKPLWNWLMEIQDTPKELGLFYVFLLPVPLYIQWDQFIILQVTLPTPSHQVLSNFMLCFKRLRPNLLKTVILLTLKIVLGDHPTRLKESWIYQI